MTSWLQLDQVPKDLHGAKCPCGKPNWSAELDSDDTYHIQLTCNNCTFQKEAYTQIEQIPPGGRKAKRSSFIQPDRYGVRSALDDVAEALESRGNKVLAAVTDALNAETSRS